MVRVALVALWLSSTVSVAVATVLPTTGAAFPLTAPAAPHATAADSDTTYPSIAVEALQFSGHTLFMDPDPSVVTKEFAFFYTSIPDTNIGYGRVRAMFHLIYQRSGGPQWHETTFGHAWSSNLIQWSVDTLAFSIDGTPWNSAHVWSPSVVHHGGKDYLFYTGVDAQDDQRIGYASTSLLDTSNTVWDPERVMVWEANRTNWAVPDPWTYFGQSQFRDAFVMNDPEHPGQLLMFFSAHDSLDFQTGQGGLVVGVARSQPGTVDAWTDLGYYASTRKSVTKVGQLEGPHVFPVRGTNTGWRLMYSNAGTPAGENGNTTIRFEKLQPGASLTDTSLAAWGAPVILKQYLNNSTTVYGWSATEQLHLGSPDGGADFLAGFTAWGPVLQGIAISRMNWNGSEFTLGRPVVTAVDEYRSPARGLTMCVTGGVHGAGRVTFDVDSPLALPAELELFDAQGRRVRTVFAGTLSVGRSQLVWDLTSADGGAVASGAYFARLAWRGGSRTTNVIVVR